MSKINFKPLADRVLVEPQAVEENSFWNYNLDTVGKNHKMESCCYWTRNSRPQNEC